MHEYNLPFTNRTDLLMASGWVKRQHVSRTIGEDLVARHSWGVAVLCALWWPEEHQLLRAALFHDSAELLVGDTPAPAKWANNGELGAALAKAEERAKQLLGLEHMFNLSNNDKLRLKIADLAELCWWAADQTRLGNRTVRHIHNKGEELVVQLTEQLNDEGAHRALIEVLRLRETL